MTTVVGRAMPGLGPRRFVRRLAPPWPLATIGLGVAVLSLLPISYLLLRAAGTDADALAFIARPRTLSIVVSSVLLGLLVGAGSVLVGLPIAWLTTRTNLPGRRAWAVLTVIPLAIPSYVTGFAFVAAFGPRGALQSLLEPLGVTRLPDIYGLPGAALVLILATYPYVVLAVRGSLMREDRSVEEAARTLGDGRMTAFRRVTLPLLAPAIGAGALLAVLYALSDFGAVSLLQFDSFSRAIYLQYRGTFDRSLAAVLALGLVVLTLAVTYGEARLRSRARHFAGTGPSRPVERVPLGRWHWPALGFMTVVVALALVVPAASIGFWLLRGLAQGEAFRDVGAAIAGSLGMGLVGAVLATAIALPVGLLLARHPSRLTTLVERSSYASFALPGIVVALALVFLTTSTVPFLYQTIILLAVAYAIRFLAHAFGPLRATLLRVGTRVEEAGRTLGDGPVRVFLGVTLPLLRPALLSGAALVFLAIVKELPMALILGPIGFETLATEIWGATSEGFYGRAAGPAALLLVMSAATVTLLLREERR
ncbi:MAG TPA: iron ABC transporter permease [Candidatus Limnocylindria bacterium]|nr:iron ABC transporter permease [Candidatus Limnocylindria bacterium]